MGRTTVRGRSATSLAFGGLLAAAAILLGGGSGEVAHASQLGTEATETGVRAGKSAATRQFQLAASHADSVVAGSTTAIVLTVTDPRGESGNEGWELRDALPRGFSYRQGSAQLITAIGATPLEPEVDGRQLSWQLPPLSAERELGGAARVEFEVRIDAGLGPQQRLINRTELRSRFASRGAGAGGSERASIVRAHFSDRIDVLTQASLTIDQRLISATESLLPGAELVARLEIRNEGPSEVPGVARVLIPEGLREVALSGDDDWACLPVGSDPESPDQDVASCGYLGRKGVVPVGVPLSLELRGRIADDLAPGDSLESVARMRWLDSDDGIGGSAPNLHESQVRWTVAAQSATSETTLLSVDAGGPGEEEGREVRLADETETETGDVGGASATKPAARPGNGASGTERRELGPRSEADAGQRSEAQGDSGGRGGRESTVQGAAPQLAVTGADSFALSVLAILLIVLGGSGVILRKRRPRTAE